YHTPLNKNCSAVILKKLPKKLGDPEKFLIPCGFNKLKCKALADLGASINLMPLSVWKKLGLPELISTRMTLELANRAICTPVGIARDVFVPVGKFTFPADFVIVDYESDPRVPLILSRPFLRTARALIDVHGEEMILRDGDERLTLNMRHDTLSYSNQPQRESINLINVFNDSSEDFLDDLFSTNQPSGNPTSHPILTSSEVKYDTFDPEGGNVLPEKLLDLDFTKDLHPLLHVNPISGSTTYSSSPNQFLEEFADELALITFPPEYDDDLQFDIESDPKEIEYLLYHDPIKDIDSSLKYLIDQNNLADLNKNFVDSVPKMFTEEHALYYSSPSLFDEYDDDLFEDESDTENVYDDPFDSKGEKIKESKLLMDELDLPCDFLPSSETHFHLRIFFGVDALPSTNNEDKGEKIKESKLLMDELDLPCDFLPSSEYDSFPSEDFFGVDALPSTNNKDKGEKIKESKLFMDELDLPCDFLPYFEYDSFPSEDFFGVDALTSTNNEDKLAISHASLMIEDVDPPLYELLFFKEVLRSKMLLQFSSENEEKVFKPGIYTSEKVHSSLIQNYLIKAIKFSKSTKFLKAR
nr:reverse transcriptase domain-containing protein [Tanacetum cinerariifolium]